MAQNVTIAGNSYPDVPAVNIPKTGGGLATFYDASGIDYAGSPTSGGNANVTNAILYGTVDSTSTSTAYTATVAGLEALVDGTCIMLRNGVVTSAAGFTIDVNNLGAKPVYTNLAAATAESTKFNVNYTLLFVYDSTRVSGGCWVCYNGYDSNTNTIGYQVRTNSGNKTAADTGYRYRIWLTSADGSKWVPINTSTSTNGTSNRTLNTRHIDPFGPIVYRSTNGTCNSGTGLGATGIWQQYTLTIGYSYMASGFSLAFPDSVYLKCTPQTDGSAKMESIVQALPSTKDGKIYIYLGTAYSATNMELEINHPVYWHDGTGIRAWTGAEGGGGSTVTVTQSLSSGTQVASISVDGTATALYAPTPPTASTTTPSMDGTASYGSGTSYARSNHVHPTDTSRQATLVSGTNIKTVNGESILGSGDLTVGGATYSTTTATIATSAWSGTTATVNVTGVTASNDVIVAPAPASISAWASAGIYCSAQGAGTLTFVCSTAPSESVTANVMVFEGKVMLYIVFSNVYRVTADKNYAKAGETVTVSSQYAKDLYVKNMAATTIYYTFSIQAGGTYSFVMPEDDVQITLQSGGGPD